MPDWQALKNNSQKEQESAENHTYKSYSRQLVVTGEAGMGVLKFPVNLIKIRILFRIKF
jgi:hypothetical protein